MSFSVALKGGWFLLKKGECASAFTPEDFTPDELLYGKTAKEFIDREVIPNSDAIEAKDLALSEKLLRRSGELGLMMADVPEAHGGMALPKTLCALIAETVSGQGSFQTMFMAHTGIGTLPIVYYGTEAQRGNYLPGLASGRLMGAYCLTEPSAGSDALGAKAKAVLSEDGTHYVLNGTKQFITNTAFADVFTVFAKVDGVHFTGFILDRDTPGLSFGPEEHKMGIRGSSTRTVIMQDARVPVENVLGEVGQGHKIAFNILNIGRFKLGMAMVGTAKRVLADTLAYTLERKQFGKRIAEFGAIREKLAQMCARIYAVESAAYRTAGLIEGLLAGSEDKYGEAGLAAIEEYSVECAMIKVLGSEMNHLVTDEAVQCLGGYGFCAEYPMERHYRDNRINRIFEGTNEINRIVVSTMLLRKAASGALPLDEAATAFSPATPGEGPLAAESALVENLKKVALLLLTLTASKYGKGAGGEQAILLRLADVVMEAYTAESTLLRAKKDIERRGAAAALPEAIAKIVVEEALEKAETLALQILSAMGEGKRMSAVAALTFRDAASAIRQREIVSARIIEMERVVL